MSGSLPQGFVMNRVKIDLKYCYGIRALKHEFDFSKGGPVYAVYAPNGSMKSSLAQTFKDASTGAKPIDRIFPARETQSNIIDETDAQITGGRILVFGPYDETQGVSEKTSTLLVNAALREKHEKMRKDIEAARVALSAALKKQASTKANLESEISNAIMRRPNAYEAALERIKGEIANENESPFANVKYDTIFNESVLKAIASTDLAKLIQAYTVQYNSLLEKSVFFKKGTFDYYNAGEIAKSLANHGFFKAKHTVRLHGKAEAKEITDRKQLEALIEEEKASILADEKLRKTFDEIFKKLHANEKVREFAQYISEPDNEPILSRLDNVEAFRQDVFKSYIKANEDAFLDLMGKIDAARSQEEELRVAALAEKTRWQEVIDIFNGRFVVPFKLEAHNAVDVILGRQSVPELAFKYVDEKDEAPLQKDKLLAALSTGEKKAYYILNVMFEVETRRQLGEETLVVVDDIADSFDYQNKYAIIQYLIDMKENGNFKQIVMTHNFDFFRTISTRLVGYGHCLMTEKTAAGIALQPAEAINNIFALDWRKNFFTDDKKKIASIPFLRNLVEFTRSDTDPDFILLTSMLHWKSDSATLTVADLDGLYQRICGGADKSQDAQRKIIDVIETCADACLAAPAGMNFENKVVLAIAVRIWAERFMVERINDPASIAKIEKNQTYRLLTLLKKKNLGSDTVIGVLDRVCLVTPENIHLNSFMYEPIIDMADEELRRLWKQTKALA